MKCEKGIILAGGTGSRLYPLTITVNKQLMPIYDKPAIYYPLTSLMLAGIRDILIISGPQDLKAMEALLGDGRQFGLKLQYQVQESPKGLPDGFIVAEKFIDQKPVAMILGDNFFYGQGLTGVLLDCAKNVSNAHILLYSVKDPSRYGVAQIDGKENLLGLVEKPETFISSWAVTGFYFFPGDVAERAKRLKPSKRGELEITELISSYINEKKIEFYKLGRGTVWFDAGTPDALLEASNFVEVIQNRQNLLIASPEEIAWRMEFIARKEYEKLIEAMPKGIYRNSLEATFIT
jgi:glucose-1-phosphate thymidylyltransferase